MAAWTIAPDGLHLLRDGADDFLLADTQWAAFANATLAEFTDAAVLRARQGFTGLLLSVLPLVHDSSAGAQSPFPTDGDDRLVLGPLRRDYRDEVVEKLRAARAAGLTPLLVPLWNCYLPGTWAGEGHEELAMDEAQIAAYLEDLVPAVTEFEPVWLASGDDNFASEAANRLYPVIVAHLRRLSPGTLIGLHPGGDTLPPQELSDLVDIVIHQSGHDGSDRERDWPDIPTLIAGETLAQGRPLMMNAEPPYEGHGRRGGGARHRAHDVRLASWRSILSGASAGLGYGAHGVWSWHRRGAEFTSEGWSGIPFPAQVALQFPGAWSVGDLRRLVLAERLWGLRDATSRLLGEDRSGARAGATESEDVVVLHCPEPFRLIVRLDPQRYELVRSVDLGTGRDEVVRTTALEGALRIEQPEFLADGLHVLRRVR